MSAARIVVEVVPEDESAKLFEFGIRETMAKLCPDIPFEFDQCTREGTSKIGEELSNVAGKAVAALSDSPKSHCLYVVPCQLSVNHEAMNDSERSLIIAVAGKDRCMALNIITFRFDPTPEEESEYVEQVLRQARENLVNKKLTKEDEAIALRLTDIAFFGYISAMNMVNPPAEQKNIAN